MEQLSAWFVGSIRLGSHVAKGGVVLIVFFFPLLGTSLRSSVAMTAEVVTERETTFVHLASGEKSSPLIFLIPGNPGICEYYVEFVNELGRQLPGHEIIAPSHCGFDLDSAPGVFNDNAFNLEQQVNHKIGFLESKVDTPRKVIVLGHSVGAWIAQRVAMNFKDSAKVKIEFVGLLTPTVQDIAKSDRGSRFTTLIRYVSPRICAGTLRILYYLVPGIFWRLLVRRLFRKKQNPEFIRQVSLRYIQRPSIVYQTLSLATEEMQKITSDSEPEEIKGFWDSNTFTIWGFFAQSDHWVSDTTRQSLFDKYAHKPNVHFEIVPDNSIPHAFCINSSDSAADYVAAAIKKFECPVSQAKPLEASIEELKIEESQAIEPKAVDSVAQPKLAGLPGETSSAEPKLAEPRDTSPSQRGGISPTKVPSVPPPPIPAERVSSSPSLASADIRGAGVSSAASSRADAVSVNSGNAGPKVERVLTPTTPASKTTSTEGSQTPRSTNSKESGGKRASVRKLGRVLSRKKSEKK